MSRRLLAGLMCLLLAGCAVSGEVASVSSAASASPAPAVTHLVTALSPTDAPTATPAPTPTPLFVPKDENGNLILNEDLEASFTQQTFPLPKTPVVLIYHTHAEEAYRQTEEYTYEETGPETYKTLDPTRSVVAIGEQLKEALEQRGFTVIHDTTDVEPPEILSAYSRSLLLMQAHPEADIYVDLHRNTANVRMRRDDVVMLEGERCAKMFFVVGTSIGTYEGEYDTAHDWQQNYGLAKALTERLRETDEALAGDIRLKVGRYNQHVSPYCLLVEVGHNANTFSDAVHAVPYLADALAAVFPFSAE